MLLVEQNAARTVELADRTYVLRSAAGSRSSGTREELAAPSRARRRSTSVLTGDGTLADVTLSSLIQHVIDAISLGSLYALFALGIALIFGIMRLVNFAHGELIMAGAYALVLISLPAPLLVLARARDRRRARARDGADRLPAGAGAPARRRC